VILPKLDQDMEEGEVVEWLVNIGDKVEAGDEIATIETDKVTAPVESPAAGVVVSILAETGVPVSVGSVIAIIGAADETPVDAEMGGKAPAEEAGSGAQLERSSAEATGYDRSIGAAPSGVEAGAEKPLERRHMSLPIDRTGWMRPHTESPASRFAAELYRKGASSQSQERQPDLVKNSTPTLASQAVSEKTEATRRRIALDAHRRSVITTVTRSWQVPQFSVEVEVSTAATTKVIQEAKEAFPEAKISLTDILIMAMARAVRTSPHVNAWFEDDTISYFEEVDVTLMVQSERGLVAPALRAVRYSPLEEVSRQRVELVEAARRENLSRENLAPGTISLSNMGMYGVDRFNALLLPPQVAILAVGRPRHHLPGSPMCLTLSVDHRAVDGVQAADYLDALRILLEKPELLIF
jgi:pyruvate dehydrogenase E2 component (dihydrolipoamide acetyltransferase)